MGDFYQNGIITTLHNLGHRPVSEMHQDLIRFSRRRPMGLILPALFSELEGKALPLIINELKGVPYLNQIVIGWTKRMKISTCMLFNFFQNYLNTSEYYGMMDLV